MSEQPSLVEVVISRRRHIRGKLAYDSGLSALLVDKASSFENANNRMCCLGFAARKAGLKACDIRGIDDYHSLDESQRETLAKKFPRMFEADGGLNIIHDELTGINDDHHISDEEREVKLTEKGLEAGIKFIFVP